MSHLRSLRVVGVVESPDLLSLSPLEEKELGGRKTGRGKNLFEVEKIKKREKRKGLERGREKEERRSPSGGNQGRERQAGGGIACT